MLKKELRLLSPISKKAKSFSATEFSVKYIENGLDKNRFGFLISKKIDKRAVVRNRAKRIIRSCIEENLKNIKQGYDFLFILNKNIIGKERDLIKKPLISALKENNLYV